ncbi:hydroxyisourate hydrolase [Alkalilimnicola ehrlichii]|uniref:5-hydroxyisourate hydrolase n=1 Tax=Alkalilimnicola ehrlichii TaxID=351052 RepID=A0A3E0X1S1_9GAMM|nr:hydroxyisourate hydrolase [Alkalilimnicola ehrlichii]RFA24474.1 hydroxyisourate hydrolase [Alkalilimnicola ehrlichii]RFA38488.1 hydroxyisourate hydrolase [Alkalilimnicola ehrlichii]
MGRLTTHVLDTTHGCPAAELSISLYRVDRDGNRHLQLETVTNDDGRCERPLLAGLEFNVGRYELAFAVGAYFCKRGVALGDPAFLDEVVVRFGVDDSDRHYHVPLLVSPYGYSTYRGS